MTIVQPDEVGIVRRFGAVLRRALGAGSALGIALGIDRVDRIKVNQTRTLAVGAAGRSQRPVLRGSRPRGRRLPDRRPQPGHRRGTRPIPRSRSGRYLFRTVDLEASLAAISEWALTRALANRGIDELLTTGRAEVADGLTRAIQSLADQEGLGVSIVAVRLGRVVPPSAVAPAFADAARARSDRRQAITRAEEYRDRSRSEARGQAREIADAAAGRFDRLVQPARGEAARFTQVLAEARKDPGAFRQRLFLETLAELLPRFRRTVVVAAGPRPGYQPLRR